MKYYLFGCLRHVAKQIIAHDAVQFRHCQIALDDLRAVFVGFVCFTGKYICKRMSDFVDTIVVLLCPGGRLLEPAVLSLDLS